MPLHAGLADRDDFILISVGTSSRDSAAKQKSMANSQGWHWLKLFDADDSTMQKYNIQYIPTLALIDPDGNLVMQGGIDSLPAFKQRLSNELDVNISGFQPGAPPPAVPGSMAPAGTGDVIRTLLIVLVIVGLVLIAIKRPK